MGLKDDFSFLTGAVRRKDVSYAAAVDDERAERREEHSAPLVWHAGKWLRIDESPVLEWVVAGVAVVWEPIQQGVFVGVMGEVLVAGSGDVHTESIVDGADSPESRGPLRSATNIEGLVHACGTGRQVYRRDAANKWVALDHGIRPAAGDEEPYSFESIDGFSRNELYAAGVFGEIWKFDGKKWERIASPTNLILSKVCCAGDGKVYIAGQQSALVRGRANAWEIVPIDAFEDQIWGLAWFNDRLYLSTLSNVYRLEPDGSVVRVNMGKDQPETCYHLSAHDGVLWSIGRKDIMSFDGKRWTRIE
jgi:hypothetical protein